MSQRTLEAHYRPNWNLAQTVGFRGYNCGYAESPGEQSFEQHQMSLVWRLLDETVIDERTTVLDAGCGIGGPSAWIVHRYRPRALVGLEYLHASVLAAARSCETAPGRPFFIQGDCHRLPLADASIDVIFNLESALHYADKRAFLRECRRVLRPGGTLCLADITTRYKLLFRPLGLFNRLPWQLNSNLHLWSTADYRQAFVDLGFNLTRHEDASDRVADSLRDGLAEIDKLSWRQRRGFRLRCVYLAGLAALLRSGKLRYDLFTACLDRPV